MEDNRRKAMNQRMNLTKSDRIKDELRRKYSSFNWEVKSMADKRADIDWLVEAQAAAKKHNTKTLQGS